MICWHSSRYCFGDQAYRSKCAGASVNRVELLLPAEDIPDAAQVFNDALGGHLPEPEDLDDVKVRTTTDFAMGIELFGPLDDTSPLAGVFDRKPRRGSIGPIVWEVEDLDATRAFVESQGYGVVYEFGSPGQRQIHLDEDQLFGFGLTFTEQSREDAGSPLNFGAKFQRVELMVDGEHIESAREAFAELLGASFSPTRHYPGPDILSSTDDFVGLELLAPASATSQIAPLFQAKGRVESDRWCGRSTILTRPPKQSSTGATGFSMNSVSQGGGKCISTPRSSSDSASRSQNVSQVNTFSQIHPQMPKAAARVSNR